MEMFTPDRQPVSLQENCTSTDAISSGNMAQSRIKCTMGGEGVCGEVYYGVVRVCVVKCTMVWCGVW